MNVYDLENVDQCLRVLYGVEIWKSRMNGTPLVYVGSISRIRE